MFVADSCGHQVNQAHMCVCVQGAHVLWASGLTAANCWLCDAWGVQPSFKQRAQDSRSLTLAIRLSAASAAPDPNHHFRSRSIGSPSPDMFEFETETMGLFKVQLSSTIMRTEATAQLNQVVLSISLLTKLLKSCCHPQHLQ